MQNLFSISKVPFLAANLMLNTIKRGLLYGENGLKHKYVKIRMRTATFCRESQKPEKSIHFDRKRYQSNLSANDSAPAFPNYLKRQIYCIIPSNHHSLMLFFVEGVPRNTRDLLNTGTILG
jgi:hypothetical protein